MKIVRTLLPCIAILMIFGGCQTVPYEGQAHDIKRKPQEEGVVGIPLNFKDEDRNKAEIRMKSNCNPGPYKIVEEGEVAIGQETKSTGKETDRKNREYDVGKLFGVPLVSGDAGGKNTENSQLVTSVKEWQISYKCVATSTPPTAKPVKKVR